MQNEIYLWVKSQQFISMFSPILIVIRILQTKAIGAKSSPLTARDKQIWEWMRRDAEAAEEADEEDNCSEENEKEEKW